MTAESGKTIFEELSEQFDKLCQERHDAGAKEYGVFTFLENDVVRMMAEELADTANYCRMQFIKLMLLQNMLEGELAEKLGEGTEGVYDADIAIGIKSFKGTRDVGWGEKRQ